MNGNSLPAAFLLAMAAFQANAGELIVHVSHVDSARGFVRVAIHTSESGYLSKDDAHPLRQAKVEAQSPNVTLSFNDVPAGKYAIKVFHDENGNEILDRNFFGAPTEPYGISNNVRGRFSLPSFHDAQITVEGATTEARVKLARNRFP